MLIWVFQETTVKMALNIKGFYSGKRLKVNQEGVNKSRERLQTVMLVFPVKERERLGESFPWTES